MSRISIRLFAGAAAAFGAPETELDGVGTVAELVTALGELGDPRFRAVLAQCSFFVDGEHRTDLETALAEGNRVDVLPPFAGG